MCFFAKNGMENAFFICFILIICKFFSLFLKEKVNFKAVWHRKRLVLLLCYWLENQNG